jgi:hypothetical protein
MHRPTINAHILSACQQFCPAITFLKDKVKFTWFRNGDSEGEPALQLIYSYRTDAIEKLETFKDDPSLATAREQAAYVEGVIHTIRAAF